MNKINTRAQLLRLKLNELNVKPALDHGMSRYRVEFRNYPELVERQLLSVITSGPFILWYDEEQPEDMRLRAVLSKITDDTWTSLSAPPDLMQKWLYLGGWSCVDVLSSRVLDYVKIMTQIPNDRRAEVLMGLGGSIYIDAFTDNTEWEIWIAKYGNGKHVYI